MKPKSQVSKDDQMLMFNGFIQVRQFKQLINLQRSHGYEAQVESISINTVEKARRQGMAQMNKKDAFISDYFWLSVKSVIAKMSNRNFRTFMAHQSENHDKIDGLIASLERDLISLQRVVHPSCEVFKEFEGRPSFHRGTDSYRKELREGGSVKKNFGNWDEQLAEDSEIPLRGPGVSSLRKPRFARVDDDQSSVNRPTEQKSFHGRRVSNSYRGNVWKRPLTQSEYMLF